MEIVLYFGTLFLMFVSALFVAVIFGCKALDGLFEFPSEREEEKEETSLPDR